MVVDVVGEKKKKKVIEMGWIWNLIPNSEMNQVQKTTARSVFTCLKFQCMWLVRINNECR